MIETLRTGLVSRLSWLVCGDHHLYSSWLLERKQLQQLNRKLRLPRPPPHHPISVATSVTSSRLMGTTQVMFACSYSRRTLVGLYFNCKFLLDLFWQKSQLRIDLLRYIVFAASVPLHYLTQFPFRNCRMWFSGRICCYWSLWCWRHRLLYHSV